MDEIVQSVADVKRRLDEGFSSKEDLSKMISEAVGKHVASRTAPVDTHQFDEIPDAKGLVQRYDIKTLDDIGCIQNAKTDFYGGLKIANGELQVEDERVSALQTAMDDCTFVHCALLACNSDYKNMVASGRELQAAKSLKSHQRVMRLVDGMKTQLDTATSGGISEWIPTLWSTQLTDAIRMQHIVAGLFSDLSMPSDPFRMPTQTAKPMASIVAEGAAPTSTSHGAGKMTTAQRDISTTIFKYFLDFTDEADEDSIIPLIPLIRKWIVEAMVRGEETAIINGDTSATHQDSDTHAASAEAPEKAWDGLRQLGSANFFNSTNPNPFTVTSLRNTRALLGLEIKAIPTDLVWITSPLGVLNMIQMAEVLTIDKFGSNATILSGQIGSVDGSPIIVSEHVREDLNATGVYDGVTTNLTEAIIVHKPSFIRGHRRNVRVEADKNIKTSVQTMVSSMRKGFLDIQDQSIFDGIAICGNFN